jgi:hypothetical protein
VTKAQTDTYRAALVAAREAFDKSTSRLIAVKAELEILDDEIVRLRRTITALAALCTESPGFDKLGITDSCMKVMERAKTSYTTADVVAELDTMGFDVASQKNINASVHSILARLHHQGKIQRIQDKEKTTWRGPNFDPEVDADIPF